MNQVPKKTLSDNIKMLKKDGLINGAKIRTVAKDGKQRFQEVFTLEETIAIGFRLRNDREDFLLVRKGFIMNVPQGLN